MRSNIIKMIAVTLGVPLEIAYVSTKMCTKRQSIVLKPFIYTNTMFNHPLAQHSSSKRLRTFLHQNQHFSSHSTKKKVNTTKSRSHLFKRSFLSIFNNILCSSFSYTMQIKQILKSSVIQHLENFLFSAA